MFGHVRKLFFFPMSIIELTSFFFHVGTTTCGGGGGRKANEVETLKLLGMHKSGGTTLSPFIIVTKLQYVTRKLDLSIVHEHQR